MIVYVGYIDGHNVDVDKYNTYGLLHCSKKGEKQKYIDSHNPNLEYLLQRTPPKRLEITAGSKQQMVKYLRRYYKKLGIDYKTVSIKWPAW